MIVVTPLEADVTLNCLGLPDPGSLTVATELLELVESDCIFEWT